MSIWRQGGPTQDGLSAFCQGADPQKRRTRSSTPRNLRFTAPWPRTDRVPPVSFEFHPSLPSNRFPSRSSDAYGPIQILCGRRSLAVGAGHVGLRQSPPRTRSGVSSMKTMRLTVAESTRRWRVNQQVRRRATSGRSCSLAKSVFYGMARPSRQHRAMASRSSVASAPQRRHCRARRQARPHRLGEPTARHQLRAWMGTGRGGLKRKDPLRHPKREPRPSEVGGRRLRPEGSNTRVPGTLVQKTAPRRRVIYEDQDARISIMARANVPLRRYVCARPNKA